MKYNRVLLISPALYEGKHLATISPRAGLGYVAESLKEAGIEVNVCDMSLGYGYDEIVGRIESFKPSMIGFTFMTLGYKNLYKLINDIKKKYPDVSTAAGGPHISTLKDKTLQECEGLDYGIILEGDKSFIDVCKGKAPEDIPGLIYRKDGKIVVNPFTDFITDLDSIPFPKYEAFELDKYPVRQIGILTSRGCPYDCIYCPVIAAIGKRFRHRSAANVAAEIEYWHNKGYRELLILDDNFTLIRKRTEEICDLLIEKNLEGLSLKCPNGIRADKVDLELLKKMRKAGFDMLAFGVESACDKVLKNIKKGEGIAIIEQRIKEACELGFDVDLFFILGSPGETVEDIEKSFELAKRYQVRSAKFYNIIPFPATELYSWIEKNNLFLKPPEELLNSASHFENEPYFFTPELSADDRKKMFAKGKNITRSVRMKHIMRKMKTPYIVSYIFSRFYTIPFVENQVLNDPIAIKIKEIVKALFMHKDFTKQGGHLS